MRLTCRGRIVAAVVATLLMSWALHVLDEGYHECLNRGNSQAVCSR